MPRLYFIGYDLEHLNGDDSNVRYYYQDAIAASEALKAHTAKAELDTVTFRKAVFDLDNVLLKVGLNRPISVKMEQMFGQACADIGSEVNIQSINEVGALVARIEAEK